MRACGVPQAGHNKGSDQCTRTFELAVGVAEVVSHVVQLAGEKPT